MNVDTLSVKKLFSSIFIGVMLSMLLITIIIFYITSSEIVLMTGVIFIFCSLIWITILTWGFGKRLSLFTSELCKILDNMISNDEIPKKDEDSDTMFARINHRLNRLYQIMHENNCKVSKERQELQTLVSDISHQVKTPISNLKMVADTLLTKSMTEAERIEFTKDICNQTNKLYFLFQALVKTSRLETGVIRLEKKTSRLYDTVAQALSGIIYTAEEKNITVVLPVELDGDTVDKKFMDTIVTMLGLKDKLNNMPNNLSGGQQQRVAIARALITKPAIILADEPTGNLDSKTSGDVLGLLKRTSAEFNQTIIMITHNDDIARMADRIIRIEDGKIIGGMEL